MTDRVLAASTEAFEAHVKLRVQQMFEAARQRGDRAAPITGETIYYDEPPAHHAQLEARAVRAVLAKKFFEENEAPPWAVKLGGLPISSDEIVELLNGVHQGKRRPRMLAAYGRHVQSAGWKLEYVKPFECFY